MPDSSGPYARCYTWQCVAKPVVVTCPLHLASFSTLDRSDRQDLTTLKDPTGGTVCRYGMLEPRGLVQNRPHGTFWAGCEALRRKDRCKEVSARPPQTSSRLATLISPKSAGFLRAPQRH